MSLSILNLYQIYFDESVISKQFDIGLDIMLLLSTLLLVSKFVAIYEVFEP